MTIGFRELDLDVISIKKMTNKNFAGGFYRLSFLPSALSASAMPPHNSHGYHILPATTCGSVHGAYMIYVNGVEWRTTAEQ